MCNRNRDEGVHRSSHQLDATYHSETYFRWKYVSEIASSVSYNLECVRIIRETFSHVDLNVISIVVRILISVITYTFVN